MTKLSRILVAAPLALGFTLAAAAPAAAVVETFATYSAPTNARNFRFVNSGNAGARPNDAIVYTTATPTATVPGAAPVTFSFLIPELAPFVTDVAALYTFNGVIAKNSPVSASGAFTQGGFSGSFSFVTTSAITVSGPNFTTHTYAAGSNLLSGSFTNGNFVGNIGATSGSSFASGPAGVNITFTSDFLDFTDAVALDRAQSLTAVTQRFSKHAGPNGALSSFRGVAGGQFSSDPVPIVNFLSPVPEPKTWALMLGGFGLVGVSLRRRKRIATTLA